MTITLRIHLSQYKTLEKDDYIFVYFSENPEKI